MSQQASHSEHTFPVVCAWCGSEIRRERTPERQEICRRCFQSMIDEHIRRAARPQAATHDSDR